MYKCGHKPQNNQVLQGLDNPGLKYKHTVPVCRGIGELQARIDIVFIENYRPV
jgi:hypothetical protein